MEAEKKSAGVRMIYAQACRKFNHGDLYFIPRGGGVVESPLLFQLLDIKARNGKNVQELVRTHFESISANLSLRSRLRSPEVISGQI